MCTRRPKPEGQAAVLIWRAVNLFEQCALSLTLYMNHESRGHESVKQKPADSLKNTHLWVVAPRLLRDGVRCLF